MLFHCFFISCIVLLYLNLFSHFFTDVRVSAQLCLTLCDLRNCSLPGFSHHGVLQARILEWVAISSSRGSLQPGDPTCVSCNSCIGSGFFFFFKLLSHLGSLYWYIFRFQFLFLKVYYLFSPSYWIFLGYDTEVKLINLRKDSALSLVLKIIINIIKSYMLVCWTFF